jgi:hypothetical protein
MGDEHEREHHDPITERATAALEMNMKISLVLPLFLAMAGHSSLVMAQSAGTFTATGSMATPRAFHTATLLVNGMVLIAGGTTDFIGPVATAEIYDPAKGTFTAAGNMTSPRSGHTATVLPDGKVLIAGGTVSINQGMVPSNGAETYDPSTGAFAATGNMVSGHVCQQAILLGNGKVLIVGGSSSGQPPQAELYDPAAGTFAPAGTYATATFDFNTCQGGVATLLPSGKVLIIWEGAHAEIYDPEAGSFTATAVPNSTQVFDDGLPTATLLLNGKALVAGGADVSGIYASAESYDPSTGTYTATGNMAMGRTENTATLLPDGKVLMAGSYLFGGGALFSAELYDQVAGAFTLTGPMTTTRSLHTATLLNDGRVLVAGGETFGRTTRLADLYNPSVLAPAPRLFAIAGNAAVQGAIWHASSGAIASPDSPAVAGEILSMYTNSLSDGGLIPPQVAIGGQLGGIVYFGAAPGYPGYNQVNFRVPSGVTAGPAVPVRLTYLTRPSNAVTVGVQ